MLNSTAGAWPAVAASQSSGIYHLSPPLASPGVWGQSAAPSPPRLPGATLMHRLRGQASISWRDGRAFVRYGKLQCVPSALHISPPLRYSSDLDEIPAASEPSLLAGCVPLSSTSSPARCIALSTFSHADGCFSHLGLKMRPRVDRSPPLWGYNFQNGLT